MDTSKDARLQLIAELRAAHGPNFEESSWWRVDADLPVAFARGFTVRWRVGGESWVVEAFGRLIDDQRHTGRMIRFVDNLIAAGQP